MVCLYSTPPPASRWHWRSEERRASCAAGPTPRNTAIPSSCPKNSFYAPENVVDGCSRVWRQPHLWCSAPEAAPWLELRWDTPRAFDTILLYLDPELSMEIPSSRTDHWEDHHKFAARKGMPPQLMRDVSVQALTENGWRTVARCTGNWRRLLELSAGEAVTATALRLVCEKTWGDERAHLFEVRVYRQHR